MSKREPAGRLARMLALASAATIAASYPAVSVTAEEMIPVAGLNAPVFLNRDDNGVMHIQAVDEASMAFAQGYVHARDRLFQMDLLRRTASGTLAELLGPSVLADDVMLRTIGLRRAAERTLPLLSDEVRNALDAYARGVNAYRAANPPPLEYALLELSTVAEWTALDSVAIAKLISFQLSIDLDDIDRTKALLTYRAALNDAQHPTRGDDLFFQDLWRVAPFEAVATVPTPPSPAGLSTRERRTAASVLDDKVLSLTRAWQDRLHGAPRFNRIVTARAAGAGSNAFAVSGRLTGDRKPLLANDPHLDLGVPSIFYPIRLRTQLAGFDVRGASFAGVPYAVQGINPFLAWGVTTSGADVTDIYQEQLVPDPSLPSGLSTVFAGQPEPVQAIPEQYRFNVIGDGALDNSLPPPAGSVPAATLIVPRRNNGPIIEADLATGAALSLQWTGFGPTFELEAFRGFNRARNRAEFERALQRFDTGSQNFLYADRAGTIAYYLSGEIPLREDLEKGVPIMPPFLIRSGLGGQEWVLDPAPPPGQAKDRAIPYAILPASEMPRAINPPAGYLLSANNDPLDDTFDNDALNQLRKRGGIRYISADYNMGIRAKRIDEMIGERIAPRGMSFEDLQEIQADVVMLDAKIFVPQQILPAFDGVNASSHPTLRALATDPRVAEAAERLRRWDFTAPTGVADGFDAADMDGQPGPVSPTEIEHSIAATIYSLWRSHMVANTIDRTLADLGGLPRPRSRYAIRALRHLLDTFEATQGKGASGIDFFTVAGVDDPATRRDILILQSLRDALDRLASASFAPAFGGSPNQDNYRWGRLHRLEVNHPLGGPFSLTSAEGPFPPPFPGLPGIPVDGGFEVVDRSTHDVRAGLAKSEPAEEAKAVNDFVYDYGAAQRFVARLDGRGNRTENALPGGVSGVLGSPFYDNLFGPWLTNDTFDLSPCPGHCGTPEMLVPAAAP